MIRAETRRPIRHVISSSCDTARSRAASIASASALSSAVGSCWRCCDQLCKCLSASRTRSAFSISIGGNSMRERLLLPLVCVATDSLCAASSVSWLAGEPTDNGCRALARCPLSGGCPSGWAAAAHRANTAAVHLGGPRQREAMGLTASEAELRKKDA
eukprot:scaffold100878_cov81-Phaeocystis_antarctica.AAC.4